MFSRQHVGAVTGQGQLEEDANKAVTGLDDREDRLGHIVQAAQALGLKVLDLHQEPVRLAAIQDEGLVREDLG